MRARAATADAELDDFGATIAATVRGLTAVRNMSAADVAAAIGMNRSTYHRRLHGGFTASDVARLALFFGVPVQDLYDGRITTTWLPRQDSSLEPSDYRTFTRYALAA